MLTSPLNLALLASFLVFGMLRQCSYLFSCLDIYQPWYLKLNQDMLPFGMLLQCSYLFLCLAVYINHGLFAHEECWPQLSPIKLASFLGFGILFELSLMLCLAFWHVRIRIGLRIANPGFVHIECGPQSGRVGIFSCLWHATLSSLDFNHVIFNSTKTQGHLACCGFLFSCQDFKHRF